MNKNLIYFMLVMFTLILTSCGAAPAGGDAVAGAPMATREMVGEAAAADAPAFFATAEALPLSPEVTTRVVRSETELSEYFSLPMLTPSSAGDRRLVYTLDVSLQTREFLQGMRLLLDTVAQTRGYIISAHVQGYDLWQSNPTPRNGIFHFRVPTEELPSFIITLENNYNILRLHQEMEEVTQVYVAITWERDDLLNQEEQVLQALENLNNNENREDLERLLEETQRQIRQLEAEQAAIMANVVYSTVYIGLFEVPEVMEVPPQGIPTSTQILLALLMIVLITYFVVSERKKRNEALPKIDDEEVS